MNSVFLPRPAVLDRTLYAELTLPARLVLAVVAGLLLTAGYALHPIWWAPWLAPVPLIAATAGSSRQARLAGAIAGATAMSSVIGYYGGMTGWTVATVIALLRIVSWVSITRLAQIAARRLPLGLAMLAMPAAAAGFETLALTVSMHGAAGSLAYSQADMPALIQVAALGGVPAIVFLVMLPGSFLGLWLSKPWPGAQQRAGLAVMAALCIAVAAFSAMRLTGAAAGPTVPVTMIATDRFATIPKDWDAVWAAYRPSVERAGKSGGLVVLPEKIALLAPAGAARAAAEIGQAAHLTGATVVAGIELHDGAVYRNRALVAAPDGRIAWYDKQRLVPGWEARDTPGTAPLLLDAAGTHLGIAICKDMHIPSIAREYAARIAIMAVPAWDFGQDGWMGARMTMLRGVENGYAIARSARDGFVGAYDRTGRVVAEQATGDGIAIAEAVLPAEGAETLYAKIGNLFGWTCLAAIVALIAYAQMSGVTTARPRKVP
jgi:apolipoprotein N-acyltransferase